MALKTNKRMNDLFFSFEGRIGRGQFWLGILNVMFLATLAIVPLVVIVPWDQVMAVGADGQMSLDYMHPAMRPFWMGYFVVMAIGTWASIAICAKRFHDRGKSGWWHLIFLVPYAGMWGWIELGFLRGDAETNAYGSPAISP